MRLSFRFQSKDAVAVVLLVVAGMAYYGRYHDYGFNTGDEGSVVLLTKRILEGERPYVDLGLGYGLLWYYPIALLFKITGVSFIAARIYFLSLALASSLLAWATVRRSTGSVALASGVSLLVLALPGDLQSVYIPLAVLANMLAVSCLDLDRPSLAPGRFFASALIVAFTWHVRADIGFAAACVLIGTLIWHALSHPPRSWAAHLGGLTVRLGAAALVPTLPLALVAYRQGFLGRFLDYSGWPLRYLFKTVTLFRTGSFEGPAADAPAQAGTTLARVPLSAIWEGGVLQVFATLTYLPLYTLGLIAALACLLMLRRRREGRAVVGDDTVGVLALVGLACSTFPQFFLFRPEPAHLSFFMPGYAVMAAVCIGRWVLLPPGAPTTALERPHAGSAARSPLRIALGGLLALHLGIYLVFGLGIQGTGSMVARAPGRTERYVGKNGVDVAVTPVERYLFNMVSRVVAEHTDEDDVLLCFPFGPGWNVITDRWTSMYTLYVDDSMLRTGIQERIIKQIETQRPPVILIDDWPVNGTEISRFKNWATRVMDHIAADYAVAESYGTLELYVLRSSLEDRSDSRL